MFVGTIFTLFVLPSFYLWLAEKREPSIDGDDELYAYIEEGHPLDANVDDEENVVGFAK